LSKAVAALLGLEKQLRKASEPAQLYYTVVNQMDQCVPYTHAVLLVGEELGRANVMAISDVPTVDYTSPFVLWVERLAKHLTGTETGSNQTVLTPSDLPADLAEDWSEFSLPGYLLWQPLPVEARDDKPVGVALLLGDRAWSEEERGISAHIAASIGHAIFALRRHQPMAGFWGRFRQRKVLLSVSAIAVVLLSLPVKLTVLAPMEVIPDAPRIIAAPMDGVVGSVEVFPNQRVKSGDILAQMESSDLESEAAVAQQALAVSQARLLTAQQSGFMDPAEKARVAELAADVSLKESQWKFAYSRLERSTIKAESSGIVVLEDPSEWQGRPVSTGERILQVADPDDIAFEISLPVKDSVALEPGADVRIFLDSDPLNPWPAKLRHAGYEPRKSPDQQMVYRLVAELNEDISSRGSFPRIGLRGTARIDGDTVSAFFYLFRRPITAARQWLGW